MARVHPGLFSRLAGYRADPAEADTILDGWLRRFQAVGDAALRRTVLREGLDGFDDASLIAVLHQLDRRARSGGGDARWMLTELAVSPGVIQEMPYERRTELYAAARALDFREVAHRFLGDRPSKRAARAADNPQLELASGIRKSAARARDRNLIDRLLHDRDPGVIRGLLDNPRLVERDAVKIAALRPTAPEVLQEVARHPRWSSNYRVRKALAFNPCTPTSLARQLVRTLLHQDLRALRDTGTVDSELRAEANLLLAGPSTT